MKKVGKITRPFRYDLNQILYDYTVKVTNRFKGLDLVDRVPEELWTEVSNIVQEAVTKIIPKKKKYKKAEWLSEEVLQIAEERREAKARKKGKMKPNERKVSEDSRRDGCVLSLSVGCDSLLPFDCSPPGLSVHGLLQARILEWVAVSPSRGSS